MPEFTSHVPGTFCWPELATTDQKGAVAFYRGLFGWDVVESPVGPGMTYSMFNIKGKGVGAMLSMQTSFDLSEGDGASTLMRWAADVKIAGPVGSMGQRVIQPIVNQQVTRVLAALDREVQSAVAS